MSEEENEGKSRGTRSVDDTDNLISDEDEKAIDESDMIMTFQNKSKYILLHVVYSNVFLVKIVCE